MKNTFFILLVIFFVGCDIINPEEQTPAYLKIEKMDLDASAYYSSNSENISDAWVYVNSNLIGSFEMPFEIPILAEGATNIRIVPGIYKDGIKSHHHFYPYYSNFDTTLSFIPEETVSIEPKIIYTDNFQEVFNEDFESAILQFQASSQSDSTLLQTENILIEGKRSGMIISPGKDKIMEIESIDEFQVLTRTIPSYLEIEYISNVEFRVGVKANGIKQHELRLRANSSKTKIYVDLSSEIGVFSTDAKFKVFFEPVDVIAGSYLVLDNIRLLIPK